MCIRDSFVPFPLPALGKRFLGIAILSVALLMGILMAVQGSTQWENLLRFANATPFRLTDPLFERDISFYVFQLPLLYYLYGWILSALFLTLAGTAFVYFIRRSLTFIPPPTFHLLPADRSPRTCSSERTTNCSPDSTTAFKVS